MRFGLIRERKNPPDRRVVLSPRACQNVLRAFPKAEIIAEPSPIRVFSEAEYEFAGIPVASEMEHCDVLLGVKEVPVEALLPNKSYFFFSHTIKKQPYNRKLLQAVLKQHIELYDHEVITNPGGMRLVAFGRYAGIVGAYNGIRAWGLKHNGFQLPKAETMKDREALIAMLRTITLPPIKILLTGKGRVGNGAREMLTGMGLREVTPSAFREEQFPEPVFCQIDVLDYNERIDGRQLDEQDFFSNPGNYRSVFRQFARVADLYIAGHFYGDGAPYLFTREDAAQPDFQISVVADISCDVDGPVATTLRASTIADPLYGYDRLTGQETDYTKKDSIAVMAVDNLPAEIPRDSSEGFGTAFVDYVIPAFFNGDQDGILHRARMTRNGRLTERFAYLEEWVKG